MVAELIELMLIELMVSAAVAAVAGCLLRATESMFRLLVRPIEVWDALESCLQPPVACLTFGVQVFDHVCRDPILPIA